MVSAQDQAATYWMIEQETWDSSMVVQIRKDSLIFHPLKKIKKRKYSLQESEWISFSIRKDSDKNGGDQTFAQIIDRTIPAKIHQFFDDSLGKKNGTLNFPMIKNPSSNSWKSISELIYSLPKAIHQIKGIDKLGDQAFKPIAFRQGAEVSELVVEWKVTMDQMAVTIHPPGSSHAFYLKDQKGRIYSLIDQVGLEDFGEVFLTKGDELILTLLFEKVPDGIQRFHLIEGDCSVGCWSAYSIRLEKPILFSID